MNLPPTSLLCTQTNNTTTYNNSHTHTTLIWCTCTTTLGWTILPTTLLLLVIRDIIWLQCYLSKIAIANTQENINAIAVIMPPSFDDTIIQQATTHRKLTIAIPIMTIMKSWHQYISSSAPTMWPLNLWTRYRKMEDGAAGMQFDFDDEHTRQYIYIKNNQ